MINRTSGKHYYFAKDVPIDMAKDYIRLEEDTDKTESDMREALIKHSIAIMLIPPLVVLLLGYALNWIRTGFKNG